jgi:RimJ/RimL family protein N-acetyltransferase
MQTDSPSTFPAPGSPTVVRELHTAAGGRVLLRHADEQDAVACVEYLKRVGAESPYLSFGAEGPGLTPEQERLHIGRVRTRDNAFFLLAVADDAIVGCITFEGGDRLRTRHIGEFGVSVARSHWGTGVGRAMMEALISWARESRVVRKLNLRVRADNTRAIALYSRLGFVTEGRSTRDVFDDDSFHDCLLMGLAIDPVDAQSSAAT